MYSLTEFYEAGDYMKSLNFRVNVKSLITHIPCNIYIHIINYYFHGAAHIPVPRNCKSTRFYSVLPSTRFKLTHLFHTLNGVSIFYILLASISTRSQRRCTGCKFMTLVDRVCHVDNMFKVYWLTLKPRDTKTKLQIHIIWHLVASQLLIKINKYYFCWRQKLAMPVCKCYTTCCF